MRSNTRNNQSVSRMIKLMSQVFSFLVFNIFRFLHLPKNYLSLGMSGRQWLASLLICMLLSSIFCLPVRAATVISTNGSISANNFEPVNDPQWFWETAYYKLNATIEEWTISKRNGLVSDNNEEWVKSTSRESSSNDTSGTKPEDSNKKSIAETISEEKSAASTKGAIINTKTGENNTAFEKEAENKTANKQGLIENSNTKAQAKNSTVSPALVFNQLPDDERGTIYNYENNLGAPAGQTEMSAPTEAAALRIRERAGIANFSFGFPLASLSGRGIDAGADVTYNSRAWNKSQTYDPNTQTTIPHFTYDVEQSWIAPGFTTGFGYVESAVQPLYYNGSIYAYKTYPTGLIEADGTRRQLYCSQPSGSACLGYETSDGSFIRISGQVINSNPANANFNAVYPTGSKIYFAGAFGTGNYRKHYPVISQDRNGNRVRIAYTNDNSGRIDKITDTINREIKFYYGTDAAGNADKLVAVTIPGMNTGDAIQTVRFYYENLTVNAQSGFSGQVTAPNTPIQVLSYIYFPATKTGFKYDYHPNYGMIKKITRFVGMTVSDVTSLTTTGTVTNSGTWAATTEYDFPDGSTALTDVPKYTKRTDDWQGRTSATPTETFFDVPDPAVGGDRISRNSVKDKEYDPATGNSTDFEIVNETLSYYTGDWMNGLIKENSVKKKFGPTGQYTTLMSKTTYFWEQGQTAGGNRRNSILRKVEITDDAGQTKTIRYEYDQYNNKTAVEEYDFGKNETNAAPLRRTEMTYETGSGWLGANLLGLVKSMQTKVGGAIVSKTLYEYDHNGSDASIVRRDDIDIATHDTFYNPAYPEWTERICPNGELSDASQNNLSDPGGCVTIHHPGYTAASAYRGNVTKTGQMLDLAAAAISDTNSDKTDYNYDIAGNVVSATLSCCQLKTIEYGATFAETGYAYPVKETKGTSPQLITEKTYNKNIGLVTQTKNENNQTTIYEYEPDTLRQKKMTYPNGGYVLNEYSDKLIPSPVSYMRTTTLLEAGKTVQSYSYYDGRGLGIRTAAETPDGWRVSAVELNEFGNVKKTYNPFYAATPNGGVPTGTKYTEILNTDALDRTTQVRLQDNTIVQNTFSGSIVSTTDQAGKQRRQIVDALGRIVRVDEPDLNGNLGSVNAPTQPTVYEYDGNDNLKKIIQSEGSVTQTREFKYDPLSRRTHERQVEATPTLDDGGVKGTPAPTKWTRVLKYSTHGLLEEGIDARGVKMTLSYDGLNRIQSITYSDSTPAVTYTYDQARTGFFNKGELTRIETAAGDPVLRPDTPATATEFDYSNMKQVRLQRQIIGDQTYNLEYNHNLAGQLISEKYPSGKTISFGYDAGGRLSNIADANRSYISNLQFQGNGSSLSSMTLGNGTTQTFGFNDRLQMNLQEMKRGTEVLQKYTYNYGELDAGATLKNNGKLEQVESFIGNNKQWTQKFSYDSIGRLAEAKEFRGDKGNLTYKQKFDYDRFGNLYRKNALNPTAGQENPLPFAPIEDADVSKQTNRFTANTQYDDAGNVIQDTKYRNQNFWYDANGRMYKTAGTLSQNQSNAVYDALGGRVATKVDGVWTFFVYDINCKSVAEYGGLQSADEGGVKYLLQDFQGSTRAIVSQGGFVQSRMDYTAFGEEILAGTGQRTAQQGFNSNNDFNQKYAQTERDKATGLDHTWFRKLENQAGRWTSPDPYNGSMNTGNPQSLNRYSYVENQPTNFVDPSGLNLVAYCQWWHTVYDGGPNDGQEVPGSAHWLVCWTVDDGRGGGGRVDVDLGGGGAGNGNNDPDKSKRDKVAECFDKAKDALIQQYDIAVNTIRENADVDRNAALAVFAIAFSIAFATTYVTLGFGGLIGMGVAFAGYVIADTRIKTIEQNNIKSQRDLLNSKLKMAFDSCKSQAGL